MVQQTVPLSRGCVWDHSNRGRSGRLLGVGQVPVILIISVLYLRISYFAQRPVTERGAQAGVHEP